MNQTKRGYYDIDTNVEGVPATWNVEELFYLQDLQQRKMYLTENIYQEHVDDLIRHILQINREDAGIPVEERRPILLYCSSCGGSVDVGFELIDIIQNSITPVYTINLGYQYSMGLLIGIAGHKRFATSNAKFLLHDGSSFLWDSGAKIQDQAEFQKKLNIRIKQYVLDRTNISSKTYDKNFRKEWYMFADEAKELGLTDYIVGVDCSIEEIV